MAEPDFLGKLEIFWKPNYEYYLAGYQIHYAKWADIQANPAPDGHHDPYLGTGAAEGPSPITVPLEAFADASRPAFTLTGLEPGVTYAVAVSAYARFGQHSFYSKELLVTLPQPTEAEKRPRIRLAGTWLTRLSQGEASPIGWLAVPFSPSFAEAFVARVELTYEGLPTGVVLNDEGRDEDYEAGDGVWSFAVPLESPVTAPPGPYLFGLAPTDSLGRHGPPWPWLTVE